MRTTRTPEDDAPLVVPDLLSDEELENLGDGELLEAPLDDYDDLLTAGKLRAMRRARPPA